MYCAPILTYIYSFHFITLSDTMDIVSLDDCTILVDRSLNSSLSSFLDTALLLRQDEQCHVLDHDYWTSTPNKPNVNTSYRKIDRSIQTDIVETSKSTFPLVDPQGARGASEVWSNPFRVTMYTIAKSINNSLSFIYDSSVSDLADGFNGYLLEYTRRSSQFSLSFCTRPPWSSIGWWWSIDKLKIEHLSHESDSKRLN